MDEVGRKNPAAGVHIELDRHNIVLLTVTTKDRVPWLANETAQKFLQETWQTATAWLAGDYLLMPDHIHVFCAPHDLAFTIEQWITFWKRDFKQRHGRGDWSFQSRGWHHRLRAGEDCTQKWIYVQENPVRKGLVKRIEDWPFKGNGHQLIW